MIPNKVIVKLDNLFSSFADAIVIPRSTTGTISEPIRLGVLETLKIELPEKLPYKALGNLEITHHVNHRDNNLKPIFYILMATCVDNNTATMDAIEEIAFQIAEFTRKNPDIREVAMPLIGTGAGRLDPAKVYQLVTRIFIRESADECQLEIFITDEKIYQSVKKVETRILVEFNEAPNKEESFPIAEEYLSQYLVKGGIYLAGSNWGSEDRAALFFKEGVWENGYEDRFTKLIKEITPGSIILLKSTYANKEVGYLRIKGAGIVTENSGGGRSVQVNWRIKNYKADIPEKSNYRSTIGKIDKKIFLEIIRALKNGEEFLQRLFNDNNNNVPVIESYTPASKIASLVSDIDDGADQLDVRRDVTAFAKLMTAKSFKPPLAIALFGKWGSGKSFFMKKLMDRVTRLSETGNDELYCNGVAQIHFNAWSYLDANLWASIVSRIFDKLYDYINHDGASDELKKQIHDELAAKLQVVNEEVELITKQKEEVQNKITELEAEKGALKKQLDDNKAAIGKASLRQVLEKVDAEFKIQDKINNALIENASLTWDRAELERIIPKEYLNDPDEAYKKVKSMVTFARAFFDPKKVWWNIFWVGVILLGIVFIPKLLNGLTDWLKGANFIIPSLQWLAAMVTLGVPVWKRLSTTYKAWSPAVAAFWKIKTDYEKQLENALSEQEQREKQIKLDIETAQKEIIAIDQNLQQSAKIINDLEFKMKHAVATEALYSFIEKRCKSDDYRKHLGIVSVIRKDFDTLSDYFIGHQDEAKAFREKFDKPLERIILYIDDLDRCPEERVVEVLEAVNLLMAFPLFIVVVGVDLRWVKNALVKKYYIQFANDQRLEAVRSEKIDASDYLEKIFQVPFHLHPATDKSVKNMIAGLVEPAEITDTQPPTDVETRYEGKGDEDGETDLPISDRQTIPNRISDEAYLILSNLEIALMQDMSIILGNNPRAIKRFVNIYQIARAHEDFNYMKSNEERELLVVLFLLALYNGHYRKLVTSFLAYMNGYGNEEKTLSSFLQPYNENSENPKLGLLKHELDFALTDHKSYQLLQAEVMSTFKHHHVFIQRFTFDEID